MAGQFINVNAVFAVFSGSHELCSEVYKKTHAGALFPFLCMVGGCVCVCLWAACLCLASCTASKQLKHLGYAATEDLLP